VAQGKGSSVTSVLVAHRFRGGDSRRRIVVPAVAARMSAARERRTVAGDAFGQERYAAVPPGRENAGYTSATDGYYNSVEAAPSHTGAHHFGPFAISALQRADRETAVLSAHVGQLSLTADAIAAVLNRSRETCGGARPPLRSVSAPLRGVNALGRTRRVSDD
jgi:hypothetical protein